MTTIAILGAAGRMGCALVRCAERFDDLQVTAAVEQPGHPAVGQDAGAIAGTTPAGITVSSDANVIADADVLIDFSFHTAIPEHVRLAVTHGRAMVLGTTGLTPDEGESVSQAAWKVPIVWAPNMSFGMNVLFALVEKAAAILGTEYDAEIVEAHHRLKKDAPSGTALRLGKCVAAGRKQDFDAVVAHGREGDVGERPGGQIGMHALRSGDILGDHTVTLGSDGEQLILGHRVTNRDALAIGALKAARWVVAQRPALYSMKDVLGL